MQGVIWRLLGWGKIVDFVPAVVVYAEARGSKLTEKLEVPRLEARKVDIRRRLDDGERLTAQRDVKILAVSRSELLARHNRFAVGAVADEDAALGWRDEKHAVFAVVNRHCRAVVEDKDLGVLHTIDKPAYSVFLHHALTSQFEMAT